MFSKIHFEWFIIKEVIKTAWIRANRARSIRPVINMLFNPECKYQIGDGPWKKGNYYKFMKDFYGN